MIIEEKYLKLVNNTRAYLILQDIEFESYTVIS